MWINVLYWIVYLNLIKAAAKKRVNKKMFHVDEVQMHFYSLIFIINDSLRLKHVENLLKSINLHF